MHIEKMQSYTSVLNWLILGYLFLQPILKQQVLVNARNIGMRTIEKKRGSRLIALIHRKETVNFLGFPVVKFLDINESESVLRAIRMTPPDMPIDLILHTPAGLSLAAEQVARALSRHKAKVTVFVPHYAMSGGTLLALSADELVMSQDAILGSLDPTVGQYPAASILSVADRKKTEDISDSTFLLADQALKAIRQMHILIKKVLTPKVGEDKAQKLADTLTDGRFSHDYPMSVEEVRELGIDVSTQMPEEVLGLMNLFPQDNKRRPTVDYIALQYPSKAT